MVVFYSACLCMLLRGLDPVDKGGFLHVIIDRPVFYEVDCSVYAAGSILVGL